MLLAVSGGIDSFLQLFTVFIIFILVLVITWFATRWIANVQNGKVHGTNIEIVETYRLTVNKYVQIVRVGGKYLALAVCKDSVEFLAEIPDEQLQLPDKLESNIPDFKKLFEKAIKLDKNRKNKE